MKGLLLDLKKVLSPTGVRRVVRRLLANDGMALAGQLAYFFVLFLFPFLIFLVSVAGTVVEDPEATLKALVASTEGFLPREAIRILSNHLDRTLQSTASSTFVVSGLLTLVAGAASAESILVGANRSYRVRETRPFWERWAIALLLISGFTLLVATMVFLVLSPHSGAYLRRTLGLPGFLVAYWGYISWALAFLNLTLAFDILYYMAPDRDLDFKWITPGGLMTTVLVLVSNKIFILWANNIFRADQLYGQLGAGIVLLIWLFVVGLVVLAGIEINAELARATGGGEATAGDRPPETPRFGEPRSAGSREEAVRATPDGFFRDLRSVLGFAALRRVVRQLLANDGVALAGQLAYFFMLFLFPFLIFLVSIAGTVVDDPESILVDLATRLREFLPSETVDLLRNYAGRTLASTSAATFVSSILFTVGVGSGAAAAITDAANRSYGVRETRPSWKVRGIAVLLIFGFALLVSALAFVILSPPTAAFLQGEIGLLNLPGALWAVLGWTLAFLAITVILSVIYYLAPDVKVPFRWITPGGFTATVLLLAAGHILKLWIANAFRYDQLYGQLGAGVVLLTWLYATGLVVLVGIEMNAVLVQMAEERKDAGVRDGNQAG